MTPIIGIDFDNTIVCYDAIFFDVARELRLVPDSIEKTKKAVRSHIQNHLSNDHWTRLQAEIYGARLLDARPFPAVVDFFMTCHCHGIPTSIISHKSQYPAMGTQYDLRQSALMWLDRNGFFAHTIGLSSERVVFAETRREKIQYIIQHQCTHFIDDLPEVFIETCFPAAVKKILFDPNNGYDHWNGGFRVASWRELSQEFFEYAGLDNGERTYSCQTGPQGPKS